MTTRIPFFALKDHKRNEELHDALGGDDPSRAIIMALDILKSVNAVPYYKPKIKCERSSEALRKMGNDALKCDKLQEALEFYNEAMMVAPPDSRAMKLGYGNRSFVLFKSKMHTACLKDIESAIAIPTARDIDEKLKQRQKDSEDVKDFENLRKYHNYSMYGKHFFKIDGEPHPEIPCASIDVGVIMERSGPKIIAKNDIKPGTVIAIEEAVTIECSKLNILHSCYYCTKMSINLIPCDKCSNVMFCDAECKKLSMNEGHKIECQFMDVIDEMLSGPMPKLVFKTAIKLRLQCESWEEFIETSLCLGRERVRKSTINEIFDSSQVTSLLCFNENRLFVYGVMYNTCFPCATLIHYLDIVAKFFPEGEQEKKQAMQAMARVMMFLIVNGVHTTISPIVTLASTGTTVFAQAPNFGWYAFIGKLRHACIPNLLQLNLNRRMVLIAAQPIKAGDALTINYLGINVDTKIATMNTTEVFTLYGLVCNCVECCGNYMTRKKYAIKEETKRKLQKLNFGDILQNYHAKDALRVYPVLLEIIAILADYPHSEEYSAAQTVICKCLLTFGDYECQNVLLDERTLKRSLPAVPKPPDPTVD